MKNMAESLSIFKTQVTKFEHTLDSISQKHFFYLFVFLLFTFCCLSNPLML